MCPLARKCMWVPKTVLKLCMIPSTSPRFKRDHHSVKTKMRVLKQITGDYK